MELTVDMRRARVRGRSARRAYAVWRRKSARRWPRKGEACRSTGISACRGS